MGFIELLIIFAMLLVNMVFAAYELALASVSLGRLKALAEQKIRGAAVALAMKNRMEASLAIVQIGITLAGAFAAATGGAGAEEQLAPYFESVLHVPPAWADVLAILMIVLPLSAITIIIGELVPKSIAIRHSERVCLALSPCMRMFSLIIYPFMILFEKITQLIVSLFERGVTKDETTPYALGLAELQAQARALRAGRIIGPDEERIILGSSALTKIRAADVMVPAEDVAMLYAGGSLADHFNAIHLDGYTRFPVSEAPSDAQQIIGYVNIKDVFFLAKTHPQDSSLRAIVRPLKGVLPSVTIGAVFRQLMQEHLHMTLVKDEAGAVLGILTLEDILEEIVGDIQDEFDRLPRRITTSGAAWIVGGGVTLLQLSEAIQCFRMPSGLGASTIVTEWLATLSGNPLRNGDSIVFDELKILIRKMRRKKVVEAMISIQRPSPMS